MAQSFLFALGRRRADESRWLGDAVAALESGLVRGLWALAGSVGVDRASRWGGAILSAFGPMTAKHKHLINNLRVAFPEHSNRQRAQLARQVWRNIGRVLAEYPHLDTICGREHEDRLQIVDHYGLETLGTGKKAVIFISAHIGNWELAAGTCRKQKLKLDALHTTFKNPSVEAALMQFRQGLGCGFVPRQHGARGIIKALQAKHSIGLLIDQRYDGGEQVPFFGVESPTGTAAAAIAAKTGVDLVPVRVERLRDAHFKVSFFPAIRPPESLKSAREQALAMTKDVMRLFESWIREAPEQWLCLKRRWPRQAYRDLGI